MAEAGAAAAAETWLEAEKKYIVLSERDLWVTSFRRNGFTRVSRSRNRETP